MDKRMRHIQSLAEARNQTRWQMTQSLYWISRLTEDFDETIGNKEYQEHLESLDLGICPLCKVTIEADQILCEDCVAMQEEDWQNHQEEIGNAHLVSVGRG